MTDDEKKHYFLLEEYKQAYEQFRHCDNIASQKEAIFAVASFGVLALVLGKNLQFWPLAGAAFVSISLYLFHVIACERMSFIANVAIERLKEIEDIYNDDIKSVNQDNTDHENIKKNICFQTEFKEHYEEKLKDNLKQEIRKIRLKHPLKRFYSCLSYSFGQVGVRNMRKTLAILLIFLWGIVIGFSSNDINHSKSKHWPQHKQTRYHRF